MELPKVSEYGLTMDVTIRGDAKYSDGTPIVFADVVHAAQRVVDPQTGSQNANELTYLKNAAEIIDGKAEADDLGIKALSDTELQITLVVPNSFIITELTTNLLSPVNKAFAEAKGNQYGLTADNILASGLFVLKDWTGTNIAVSPVDGKSAAEVFGALAYTDIPKAQELFKTALAELGAIKVELWLVISDTDESIKVGQYLQSALQTNLPGLIINLANVPSSV